MCIHGWVQRTTQNIMHYSNAWTAVTHSGTMYSRSSLLATDNLYFNCFEATSKKASNKLQNINISTRTYFLSPNRGVALCTTYGVDSVKSVCASRNVPLAASAYHAVHYCVFPASRGTFHGQWDPVGSRPDHTNVPRYIPRFPTWHPAGCPGTPPGFPAWGLPRLPTTISPTGPSGISHLTKIPRLSTVVATGVTITGIVLYSSYRYTSYEVYISTTQNSVFRRSRCSRRCSRVFSRLISRLFPRKPMRSRLLTARGSSGEFAPQCLPWKFPLLAMKA